MSQASDFLVFVSYSWDSESHRESVKNFIQDLRKNGIDVVWDEDLSYGERIQDFMVDSIAQSDIVLIICTPNYKKRADNHISGVGFESEIITGEIYTISNEEKYIPVLFTGDWKISVPTWAIGKKGIDLSTPELYQASFPKLLLYLNNERMLDEDSTVSIEAIAIAPNGVQCVSASSDNLVCLWNIDDRQPVGFMEEPCHFIVALTITPDGSRCIAVSREGTVQVWDMATRKTIDSCQIDHRYLMLAAITPDGRWCAAHTCHKGGPRSEEMLLWDLSGEKGPSLLENCFYTSMTLSAEGENLIAARSSFRGTGIVEIINVRSGEKVPFCWKPRGRHNLLADDQVNAIAVTPDMACIVLGTCKDIAIWHKGAGSAQILPLGEWVQSIAVSPDGSRLVCGARDTLYTFDVHTKRCISFMKLIPGAQK